MPTWVVLTHDSHVWGNTVPPVRNATLQNKVGNIPKPIKTKHSLFVETSNEYLISTTPYENKKWRKNRRHCGDNGHNLKTRLQAQHWLFLAPLPHRKYRLHVVINMHTDNPAPLRINAPITTRRHRSSTWRPEVIRLHVVDGKVKRQHVSVWPAGSNLIG